MDAEYLTPPEYHRGTLLGGNVEEGASEYLTPPEYHRGTLLGGNVKEEGVRGWLGLTQDLTHPHTTHLTVHFYGPAKRAPFGVRLWSAIARPTFIHCTVEIDGCILFDQPYAAPGGWYESSSHLSGRPPAASIALPVSASYLDVEHAGRMVEGRRTQRVASAANVLVGWPRWPRNCTTSVVEILWRLGVYAPATTPDALWSELCRITGKTNGVSTTRTEPR